MLTSIGGLERGIDEWSAKSLQCFFWLEHCYFLGANHAGAMLESRESRNHRMAGVLRGWLFYCAGARCSGSSSRARWCSRGRRRGASPGMPSPGPTTRTDSCSAAPAAPPLDGAPPAGRSRPPRAAARAPFPGGGASAWGIWRRRERESRPGERARAGRGSSRAQTTAPGKNKAGRGPIGRAQFLLKG
ncbi:hypothetical protein PVAP13_2NG074200 [Panicum virgatum]|uniref:Uncharacterized protein n=1 Tax=Panicum virgatum TaxID=38727 RepID=A0A8T0VDA5_PANVG|nr:hypothetical protein PVAP13_2NG074200 [Panicum virgatum]